MERDTAAELLDWVRSHFFGKYRGVVKSNVDETNRGRLKVEVRAVLGSLQVWAMPCVPYAGAGVGFYSLPENETGVWIEFEGGDPSYPVWTGCFWADNELPDSSGAAVKIWKTEKLTVRIDDDAGELQVKTTAGSKLTLNSEVKSESGAATHTVAGGSVVSEVGAGKVEVTMAMVTVNNGALAVI